jgi:hypothetical protein
MIDKRLLETRDDDSAVTCYASLSFGKEDNERTKDDNAGDEKKPKDAPKASLTI